MKSLKDTTEMGSNLTGISRAPKEARKTLEGARKQATRGSEKQAVEARADYLLKSDGVGSLPQAKADGGRKPVKNGNMRLLLDKLSERAAFERVGVRLYDALITKVSVLGKSSNIPLLELGEIRDQELEHFQLVAAEIKKLGGDDTLKSPCANVTGVASRGLMQVVSDPRTSVAQSLSAMLTVELTDNANWELLIELCDKLTLPKMVKAFEKPLRQEAEHLRKVRTWLSDDLEKKLR